MQRPLNHSSKPRGGEAARAPTRPQAKPRTVGGASSQDPEAGRDGKRRRRGPVPIKEVVSALSRDLKKEASRHRGLTTLWQKAVGKKKAFHTRIASFESGVLTVWVDHTSTLYELTLEKEGLLQKLRRALGGEGMEDIRFQVRDIFSSFEKE